MWILQPTDRHREALGSLLTHALTRSNLVSDARLAALAIEHGLTLCSTDRDFARFPNLRWEDPLQQKNQDAESPRGVLALNASLDSHHQADQDNLFNEKASARTCYVHLYSESIWISPESN